MRNASGTHYSYTSIGGMSCTGCESNVESTVLKLSGCEHVDTEHEVGTVSVEVDVNRPALRSAVEDRGYDLQM